MSNKNFYIMLVTAGWGEPSAEVISGPDVYANRGQIIGPLPEPYIIELVVDKGAESKKIPPCDFLSMTLGLLFSQRFIELLNSLGVDNIEYFDTTVIHKPSGEKLEYKVGNILGVVSGLDLEKSEVVRSPRGVLVTITKMHLDEDKIKEHKIFRLQESKMHIVVHKSIKEAVEAAGLTGFMFVTDDEFDRSMI